MGNLEITGGLVEGEERVKGEFDNNVWVLEEVFYGNIDGIFFLF